MQGSATCCCPTTMRHGSAATQSGCRQVQRLGGLNPIMQAAGQPAADRPGVRQSAAPQPMPIGTTSNNKTEEELAAEGVQDHRGLAHRVPVARRGAQDAGELRAHRHRRAQRGPVAEFKSSSATSWARTAASPARSTRGRPGQQVRAVQNCFPDPAGGENIHNGSYPLGARHHLQAQDPPASGRPEHIPGAIERVLREGPRQIFEDQVPGGRQRPCASAPCTRTGSATWTWSASTSSRPACPEDFADIPDDESFVVPAMLEMINDTVVKAAINP